MRGHTLRGTTPLRFGLVRANMADLVESPRKRKIPEWCNGQHPNHELASWVKWLDEHGYNHKAIEAYLGIPRHFVYNVLVNGNYLHAPSIMPPALPPKPTAATALAAPTQGRLK